MLKLVKQELDADTKPIDVLKKGLTPGIHREVALGFGRFQWEGTVNRVVNMLEGKTVIEIQAKGELAYGVWPYMIVELDGEEVGGSFIDSSEWKEYSFRMKTSGGLKVLSVTFPNDGGDKEKGIDRNLYVGKARIVKDAR